MDVIQTRHVLRGLATFVPGMQALVAKRLYGTSPRYCYSVWMRHLVMAGEHGLSTTPNVVAELGPGDSLGMGLAALLSGAERFFAFDVVEYANLERNLKVFEDLRDLFARRESIPGDDEFPRVWPKLQSYAFPRHILTDSRLSASLDNARAERIRASLLDPKAAGSMVSYTIPWYDSDVVQSGTVDMIYSQAAMQYVMPLDGAYKTFYDWLRPGGFISHQIDLTSHGLAKKWNGHWSYSDFTWHLIKGNRPYFLSRAPRSAHIRAAKASGFRIVCDLPRTNHSDLSRESLAARFREMPDEDLQSSGLFLQASKDAG